METQPVMTDSANPTVQMFASKKSPQAFAAGAKPRLGIEHLKVRYAKHVVLNDVSLQVAPGQIVGLLGPNGSGKTSLLRCLTGLVQPERGLLRVDGQVLRPGSRVLRRMLGVVFQEPSLDNKLTAFENLMLGAALFGIQGAEARQRTQELLVFMELEARSQEKVQQFSGGMRRRLELARALIHRPQMLLLDEPMTGLDPLASARTWQRLLALRQMQGLTMLLSTHHADEAARCDQVVVLDRGQVVAVDSPEGLLARVSGDVIVMQAEAPEALVQELERVLDVQATIYAGEVLLEREAGHTWVPRIVEALGARRLAAISVRRPSLADAFFHLTGRGLQPASEA